MNGKVLRVWRKPRPGAPMQALDEMTLLQGAGIDGDAAASPFSPRQVLVVRQEDLDAFWLPPAYLRENVCVAGLSEREVEPGAVLRIGGGAALRLLFRCEACAAIAPRLRRLGDIRGRRGVLAMVEESGVIAPGMQVTADPQRLTALPDAPAERVCALVARIPRGMVLPFGALLRAAGLQSAYARAIPAYLRTALARGLPAWRTVDSQARIAPANVACLREEGVPFDAPCSDGRQRVAPAGFWTPRVTDILPPD